MMKKKIKEGQTLTTIKLKERIMDFCSHSSVVVYEIFRKSKYCTNNLRMIPESFIQDCILYVISHQLKSTFREEEKWNEQQQALERIKSQTYEISMNGKWKKQFNFDHAITFVVKIISKFYEQNFQGIKICCRLQSQIYVILIYGTIGLTIGMKCYQILEKTLWKNHVYQSSKLIIKRKTIDRRSFQGKKGSRGSVNNASLKSLNKAESKIHPSFTDQNESDLQMFKKNLENSLYVEPLPKLGIKKKSIESFCLNNGVEKGGKQFSQTFFKNSEEQKRKLIKKTMYSTQMSAAFTTELSKRNVQVANYYKSFKINYRLPFFSSHQMGIELCDNKNDLLDGTKQIKEEKDDHSKIENSEWNKIIRKMKEPGASQHKITLELWNKNDKENFRISEKEELENQEQQRKLERKARRGSERKKEIPVSEHISSRKGNKPLKVEDNESKGIVNDIRALENNEIEAQYSSKPYETPYSSLKPKILKNQKQVFEKSCKDRKQKVQYSIFMMPRRSKLIF